jgi:hypothetical protein
LRRISAGTYGKPSVRPGVFRERSWIFGNAARAQTRHSRRSGVRDDALVAPLPKGAKRTIRAGRSPAFVHLFTAKKSDLAARLKALRKSLAQDGVVWVSWPKKTSNVATDITEDVIRSVALPLGFVDVKVCAVDATWSGLKLVIRKSERR